MNELVRDESSGTIVRREINSSHEVVDKMIVFSDDRTEESYFVGLENLRQSDNVREDLSLDEKVSSGTRRVLHPDLVLDFLPNQNFDSQELGVNNSLAQDRKEGI